MCHPLTLRPLLFYLDYDRLCLPNLLLSLNQQSEAPKFFVSHTNSPLQPNLSFTIKAIQYNKGLKSSKITSQAF